MHDQIGVKLLRRLQLKFSQLSKHKFCRKFKDCVTVVLKSKQLNTFFLHCQFFLSERQNLHDDLCLINLLIISFDEESLLNASLYGSDSVFRNKFLRFKILKICH